MSFILQERLGTSTESGNYLRTVPTGELELSIDYRGGIRKSWKDLKKEKLEVLLGGFIASITAIQEEKRKQREEREAWQQQYEKKKQEEQEIAKRKAQEKTFFRKVELQAECWQRAESIRSYLDAIEAALAAGKIEVKDKAQMDLWLVTSRDLADRLDPIAGEWTNEPPQFAERESRNAYMPSYEPPVPNHPPYWVMKQRWKNRY